MKTYLYASIVALFGLSWPAVAQVPSTPATGTLTDTGVPDGIAFYNGRPFLIRNGRATLIDATLVPNGKILTNDGRLVGMPMNYGGFAQQPVSGQVVQPAQPAPQGQAGVVPNQPGTIGVAPQAGGTNPPTATGNTNGPAAGNGAVATGAAGKMDPKNPGAGATTDGPNTRTTGGGNTGATTKSAVSESPTSGGNTGGGARR